MLIATLAFVFRPAFAKTDDELISETSELEAVNYFLSKYPEANLRVERLENERTVIVTYFVEGQLCEPTGFLDDCVKTQMLSTVFEPTRSAYNVLTCGGPISYDYTGDIIEEIQNNNCFNPPEWYSPTVVERVPVSSSQHYIMNSTSNLPG